MQTIDSMKKRLDNPMINRMYDRLIMRPDNRLIEQLNEIPYIRLSGLADNKTVRRMTGQTASHSNIQTLKHSNG